MLEARSAINAACEQNRSVGSSAITSHCLLILEDGCSLTLSMHFRMELVMLDIYIDFNSWFVTCCKFSNGSSYNFFPACELRKQILSESSCEK